MGHVIIAMKGELSRRCQQFSFMQISFLNRKQGVPSSLTGSKDPPHTKSRFHRQPLHSLSMSRAWAGTQTPLRHSVAPGKLRWPWVTQQPGSRSRTGLEAGKVWSSFLDRCPGWMQKVATRTLGRPPCSPNFQIISETTLHSY